MSRVRALRRRARREGKPTVTSPDITLCNPVAEHFPAFIVGNAAAWEEMAKADLEAVAPDACRDLAAVAPTLGVEELNRRFRDLTVQHGVSHMVQEDSAKGQHLVLCGAGPSLADHAAEWCPQWDQVCGCNSALPYLWGRGHRVTHGFTVDQTPQMCQEWFAAPPVPYLVASTIHPHLMDLLRSRGRDLTLFHNFVGINKPPVEWADDQGELQRALYEDWLYLTFYPPSIRCGSGLNTVNRAIDVALYMGFETITLLGADCAIRTTGKKPDAHPNSPEYLAWLGQTVMHADGGSALAAGATALTLTGEIDGREWETKVDLVVSAHWLVLAERQLKGRLRVIGDTLPNALKGKPDAFLNRLPRLMDGNGKPIIIQLDGDVYVGLDKYDKAGAVWVSDTTSPRSDAMEDMQ